MRVPNVFPDRYRPTLLSALTFSSDEESGQASPLTDFSIDESEPPSPLMASGDEEETGEFIAVGLGSTKLQNAPLYRILGERGATKSFDDMLLTALVYRQPDKKARLLRANRSMNDVFPLRRRKLSQPSQSKPLDLYHDEKEAPWSTTAQRASPAYFSGGLDGEDFGYGDTGSSVSSTQQDGIPKKFSSLPTPVSSPQRKIQAVLYHVSWQYKVEVTNLLIHHIGASHTLSPLGLLVVDVNTPDIEGSVITTLARTASSPQGFQGPDGWICTGESILVPELHDPRRMIHFLLEKGGVKLAATQPYVPNLAENKQEFTADGRLISTSIVDEACLFATRFKRKPTMAKWKPKEKKEPKRNDSEGSNELVWCGWNLLLNPEGHGVRTEEAMRWERRNLKDSDCLKVRI